MRISDWSSDVCSSDLNGAGAKHLPRQDRLFAAELGDRVFEAVVHRSGITARPLFAIDLGGHGEIIWIGDLVRGHDAGAEAPASRKILALSGAVHRVQDRKSTRLNSSH